MKTSPSHISQVIGRIRAAWGEIDDASRLPVHGPQPRLHPRPTIDQLEGIYGSDELPAVVRWPYLRH